MKKENRRYIYDDNIGKYTVFYGTDGFKEYILSDKKEKYLGDIDE